MCVWVGSLVSGDWLPADPRANYKSTSQTHPTHLDRPPIMPIRELVPQHGQQPKRHHDRRRDEAQQRALVVPLDRPGAVGWEEGALAGAGAAVPRPAQTLCEEGEAEAGQAGGDGA
jgi:hypothetical protein